MSDPSGASRATTALPVAQTNLQLLNLLGDLGWSERDRCRVAAAHDLAVELFTGEYRGSGKPFLAHLVGVAAIVAEGGGTLDETLAALLHAAYFAGDFGDGRSRPTGRKVAELRRVVGPRAEALVAAYGPWPWRERIAVLLRDGPDGLSQQERSVAFVRIANDIDDHVDAGPMYLPPDYPAPLSLADAAAGADALERPELARVAHRVGAANGHRAVPPALRRSPDAARTIAPRSTTTRLRTRIAAEPGVVRRVVRDVPGARAAFHAVRRFAGGEPVAPDHPDQ